MRAAVALTAALTLAAHLVPRTELWLACLVAWVMLWFSAGSRK